jgi:hypothetical protein
VVFGKLTMELLSFGKTCELDASPDEAIGSRSCISDLTRDCDIDGGIGLKLHRNATNCIQSEGTVLPQTEKFDRIRVAKRQPHTERRDVGDHALPPEVRWLVFHMATAHPKGRLAFCASAILHGPTPSDTAQRRMARPRLFNQMMTMG